MNWILFVLLSLSSVSQAAIKSSYSLTMGHHSEATLYWQHRTVKNKNVFVIGYREAGRFPTEQVVPKDEFNKDVRELKDWRKKLIMKQSAMAGPACNETVLMSEDDGLIPVCLQGILKSEKTSFLRWYRKQTDLVSGRL